MWHQIGPRIFKVRGAVDRAMGLAAATGPAVTPAPGTERNVALTRVPLRCGGAPHPDAPGPAPRLTARPAGPAAEEQDAAHVALSAPPSRRAVPRPAPGFNLRPRARGPLP